ncbi:unnamed protein product [Heligmosomoides polygyrus]|uniref:Uncharacterized protein n=1 Tax=Heligmosomoides polygyrus TaxID=6339 RepID=A0A183GA69_HELPZ|nr:unnamed protein product [Heligmosomoides polygyrus]
MKSLTRGDKLDRIHLTYEKIFTVEPLQNAQNQRKRLLKGSPRAVNVERVHFPQYLMVWAESSGLSKTKLVFIQKEVKTKFTETNPGERGDTLAQENAKDKFGPPSLGTSSRCQRTPEWCETNLPDLWTKEAWLSNSSDLNAMDFAIWSFLEQKACSFIYSSLDAEKSCGEGVGRNFAGNDRILKNFRKRLDARIEAKGAHFECGELHVM